MDYCVCFDNLIPEIYSLFPIYAYCCLLRVGVAFRMSKHLRVPSTEDIELRSDSFARPDTTYYPRKSAGGTFWSLAATLVDCSIFKGYFYPYRCHDYPII